MILYGLPRSTETQDLSGDRKNEKDGGEMFLREMAGVQRLKGPARSDSRPPKPEPMPRQREADERAVLGELLTSPSDPAEMETGEELSYLRPGLQRRYLDRLRRGRFSMGDSLDLHQMNIDTARAALLAFIDEARGRGIGCVRIVHGKGLRSRGGPKLKGMVAKILSRHPAVLAYASCRPVDGGTGAVSVLLRKR